MNADAIRLEIDASRRAIRQDYAALRAELDFAAKARRAVVEHPLPWLGGAAILGYLFSGRKKRKAQKAAAAGSESVKRFGIFGILLTLGKLILPLAQPYLTDFATRKISGIATKFRR